MSKVMESEETGSARPRSAVVEVTGLLNNFKVPGHSMAIKVQDMANFHESLGLFKARVAKLKNTSSFGGGARCHGDGCEE